MKKILLAALCLGLLTACPNKEEIKNMKEEVSNKKVVAMKFLVAQDFSLDGLLKIQEYFFEFTEKVHLLKVEDEARKTIQGALKKSGGIKEFCSNFVMPVRYITSLEQYCSSGDFYKCSPEIKEYRNTMAKLKEVIGPDLAKSLTREPACN